MSRTKLVLAAVASVAIAAIGCENRENDARAAGGIRELTIATFGPGVLAGVGGGPRDAANVRTPDEPTFSSAVTPLGWTDEAERREAERDPGTHAVTQRTSAQLCQARMVSQRVV